MTRASDSGRSPTRTVPPPRSSATSSAALPQLGNRTPERAARARGPLTVQRASIAAARNPYALAARSPGAAVDPLTRNRLNRPASARGGAAGRPDSRSGEAPVRRPYWVSSSVRPARTRRPNAAGATPPMFAATSCRESKRRARSSPP